VSGVLLLAPESLPTVVLGLVVLTAGFFAVHTLASSWVSARSAALGVPGAGVYLCAYYLGSSAGGSLGGVAFGNGGWPATTWYLAALAVAVLVFSVNSRRTVPVATPAVVPASA